MISNLVIGVLVLCTVTVSDDKIEVHDQLTDATGQHKLLLKYAEVPDSKDEKFGSVGFDFHSLVWQTKDSSNWVQKLVITGKDFEKKEFRDRWISKLHSFDPTTGVAIIQVGEMGPPDIASNTIYAQYSWREWDLFKNKEIRTIKVCKDPFDPYESKKNTQLKPNTNNSDPEKVLDEARALADVGQYQEALEKHIWFHENALKKGFGWSGVRLSFALADWVRLGKKYPRAREALVAIRDRDEKLVLENGSVQLFQDVAAINGYLRQDDKTVALFKKLQEKKPELANSYYRTAEKGLASRGEYTICSKYIKDPVQKFNQMKALSDFSSKVGASNSHDDDQSLRSFMKDKLREETCMLLKILAATGRQEEAQKVFDKAATVFEDEKAREALKEALKTQPK